MKHFFLFLFFLISCISLQSFADRDFERRLSQIYTQKYPLLSEEEWSAILNKVQNKENYVIQKNDTLWDISRVFFGTGFYWPKIWSFNSKITNPHEILPGNTLVFSFGTLSESPSVDVADKKIPTKTFLKTPDIQDSPSLNSSKTDEATKPKKQTLAFSKKIEDVIPSPLVEPRKVLKEFPPSLPSLNYKQKPSKGSEFDLKGYYESIQNRPIIKTLSHFVLDEPTKGIGYVLDIDEKKSFAHKDSKIYVRLTNSKDYKYGETFTVLTNQGALEKANSYIFSARPFSFIVSGEIKIIKKLDKGAFYDIYEAEASKVFDRFEKNSIIIDQKIEKITLYKNKKNIPEVQEKSFSAQIIGGAPSLVEHFHEKGSLVYINSGSLNGIEKGYVLKVHENKELRKTYSSYNKSPKEIGKILIVHVDVRFSTAVVIDLKGEIYLRSGDLIP